MDTPRCQHCGVPLRYDESWGWCADPASRNLTDEPQVCVYNHWGHEPKESANAT